MQKAYQVCKGVGVVKTGITGGCYDVCEVVGWQTEVRYVLKVPIRVLDMHSVVLQPMQQQSVFLPSSAAMFVYMMS